jgi:hypothetical protein
MLQKDGRKEGLAKLTTIHNNWLIIAHHDSQPLAQQNAP